MDMSDTHLHSPPIGAWPPLDADVDPASGERWHELVAAVGAEVATPLTAALERVNALSATGQIDRDGLRALRDEIEQARRAGMIGQQLTRFASGRIRQSAERVPLADLLAGVIAHRSRETQARGISLKPVLLPADVRVDASLLFSLLNTTLDWALAHAQSQIEFTLDHQVGSARARLVCRFAHRAPDLPDATPLAALPPPLDSLTWRLLEQTAWTMGLTITRKDASGVTTMRLDFPTVGSDAVDGLSALELDDGFAPSANSQPMAGSHVLVIASRREMRVAVRDALRNMGLLIDFVSSVDEAAGFCREGLPHAVIFEAIQSGDRFAAFRDEIRAEVPQFVFIEIVEHGNVFDMSGVGGSTVARVGRDVLASSLSSALMFELSKGL